MFDWLTLPVAVAIAAVAVAIVFGVLGILVPYRRDKLKADQDVLDQIVTDADEYFAKMARFKSLVFASAGSTTATVAGIRDAASILRDVWAALEGAAFRVGRLSKPRYDGLRPLGRRIYDACTSTADGRAFLEVLATGTASTDPSKLSSAIPWPDLNTDALVYRTLAVVYRREGPLRPRRRLWWRTPSRRERTDMQIAAPLRRKRWSHDTDKELVTSVEQVRALIEDTPGLEGLSDSEINALAYQILHRS